MQPDMLRLLHIWGGAVLQGFALIYEGQGEGPEQAKDRTHFTLKPLGPGQKYSFKIRVGRAASSCAGL